MADMEALSYVGFSPPAEFLLYNMKDRVGRLRWRKLGPPLAAIFHFTRWPEDLTPDIYRAHWWLFTRRSGVLGPKDNMAELGMEEEQKEAELPTGWESRFTSDGRIYYIKWVQ